MRKTTLLIAICMTIFIGFEIQGKSQHVYTSLTTVLQNIASTKHVRLSYSPTLTNTVKVPPVDFSGSVDMVLTRLLKNSDFAFRKTGANGYYIYKSVESKKKTEKRPTIVEDTKPKPSPIKLKAKPDVLVIMKEDSAYHRFIADSVTLDMPLNIKALTVDSIDMSSMYIHYRSEPTFETIKQHLFAIKTNLLYDATLSISLGVEYIMNKRYSIDLSGGYNGWNYSDNKKMKFWFVQPELRYWRCQPLDGLFWAAHLHYGQFNWGGMLPWGITPSESFKNHRYQGWLLGAGIGVGYHWIFGQRWGLEAEIGVGYTYLNYAKYPCYKCGLKEKDGDRNFLGPTKVALSLVYVIK